MSSNHNPLKNKLGIIFPIYNEQEIILQFLSHLDLAISEISQKVEITCVAINNGSTDRSLECLLSAHFQNADMNVISLTRNFGYEIAFEVGLKEFEFDYYCLLDSDGEDPVDLLPKFYDGLNQGYDVSFGLRQLRHESKFNQVLRKFFYRVLKKIADDPFRVDVGEFSMFTSRVRNELIKEKNSYPFWRSSISRTGFKSLSFPHQRNPRIGGKSRHNKLKMLKFAFIGVLSTTTWPLRFSVYSNLLAVLLTLLLFLSQLLIPINTLYLYLLGTFYLFTISFTLSAISMYLARVYKNSLERPNYYIQNRFFLKKKSES
jgi:dolichol-phosphate mannosyltransferase